MHDKIVEARIQRERDEFIESIRDHICALASAHHDGDSCEFFKDFTRGSYNVCFFVQFFRRDKPGGATAAGGSKPDGDRWVVRVPLGSCLSMEPWEKVESEVATMQFVASRTTIPVPRVHAYSAAREKEPHGVGPFMVLEYIDGRPLDELGLDLGDDGLPAGLRLKLDAQLADVYAQLSRLRFPAVGRLVPGPGDSVRVARMPISNSMNQQALEDSGVLDMVERSASSAGFSSGKSYVSLLTDLALRMFEGNRAVTADEADARRRLYFLHQFSAFVHEQWAGSGLDGGPFVLSHGDLSEWNLLVSDDLDLLAVIDWEWAQTVPLQLFLPPLWISGSPNSALASEYDGYVERMRGLCSAVAEVEWERYGETPLAQLWADAAVRGDVLVGMALQHPPNIQDVMRGWLDGVIHGQTPTLEARVRQFIDEDPRRGALVARKLAEWASYAAEMRQAGLGEP